MGGEWLMVSWYRNKMDRDWLTEGNSVMVIGAWAGLWSSGKEIIWTGTGLQREIMS